MKAQLSIVFENLRGKAGNVVIQGGRSGLVVRPRVVGRNPSTPAQQAARSAMQKAAAAYTALTPTQLSAWQAYAETQSRPNPVTGIPYHPTANTTFIALATKFLQVSPTSAVPVAPPAAPFGGDSVAVTVGAEAGQVTFTGNKNNAAGVTTELLLQALASPVRTPRYAAYRTKGFQVFALGSLSRSFTVPPGYYAAAYRFVEIATGQASPLIPLGIVQHVTTSVEDERKAA